MQSTLELFVERGLDWFTDPQGNTRFIDHLMEEADELVDEPNTLYRGHFRGPQFGKLYRVVKDGNTTTDTYLGFAHGRCCRISPPTEED